MWKNITIYNIKKIFLSPLLFCIKTYKNILNKFKYFEFKKKKTCYWLNDQSWLCISENSFDFIEEAYQSG